jgi:hypothetical protein
MTPANSIRQGYNSEARMLNVVYTVCVAAQRFFQQAAWQVDDSNLRYKFIELSAIHNNAARQLPEAADKVQLQDISSELAAVQFWYLHQQAALHNNPPHRRMLTELANLLQQQLLALKHLTQSVHSPTAKVTLAHLSAALQMANDQLLPMLKVLPAGEQKLQT